VENSLDALQVPILYQAEKNLCLHIVGNFQIGEIEKFVGAGQVVHDENVRNASLIEGLHEIGADKTGAASDDVHA